MYFLKCFIILQVLSSCMSFDIEMEGVLRLKDSFLETFKDKVHSKHLSPSSFESKPNLRKKFSRSFIMRANTVGINRSIEFLEYVDHVKSMGVITLKSVAKEMFTGMNVQKNFTKQIETVTEDFKTTIQEYLDYVLDHKSKFTIDEEFIFLDMVETSCRVLYREQKKVLNFAISATKLIDVTNTNNHSDINNGTAETNTTKIARDGDIQRLSQIIYRQGVKTKREELRYICNKYEICRPYPAFTDYLADFIAEILKLPDEKLHTFVKTLRLVAKSNEVFFNEVIDKKDKELVLMPYISDLLIDINGLQETLLIIRGLITQRFKIINSPNLRLKMRTTVVRILLDIINQAFLYENDDLLAIEFDTVVKNIRSWNNGDRLFPESSIITLFNNIFNILDYNLSKDARSEMQVLIETLTQGSSKNEELFSKLLSEGSKYVKGEDMLHEIQII